MRSVTWVAALGVQLGLLLLTVPALVPGLGVPTWHHNASLLASILGCAAFGRRMLDRRFLGIGVLTTTFLALASAFLILYLKDDLKTSGLKDWAKWWHVTWSWLALVFFVMHTWVNRAGLKRSLERLRAGWRGKTLFDGALLLILVAIPLTWSPWGAATIQDPNYIPLTLYTWLAFAAPTYAAWGLAVWRLRAGRPLAWAGRKPTQAFVDGWLVPMTLLANLSGFPILYFATKDTDLKYVAKYWHTWPSVAMAILVFAHTIQFLPAVAKYMAKRRADPSEVA